MLIVILESYLRLLCVLSSCLYILYWTCHTTYSSSARSLLIRPKGLCKHRGPLWYPGDCVKHVPTASIRINGITNVLSLCNIEFSSFSFGNNIYKFISSCTVGRMYRFVWGCSKGKNMHNLLLIRFDVSITHKIFPVADRYEQCHDVISKWIEYSTRTIAGREGLNACIM